MQAAQWQQQDLLRQSDFLRERELLHRENKLLELMKREGEVLKQEAAYGERNSEAVKRAQAADVDRDQARTLSLKEKEMDARERKRSVHGCVCVFQRRGAQRALEPPTSG